MARRGYSETAALTYLAADVTAGATDFTAQDASTWAGISTNGPFIVTLDRGRASEERLLCTAVNTTTGAVTGVTRGYHGTTAVAHSAAVCTVEHTSAAIDFDEANGHINDTTLDHHTQYVRTDGSRAITGNQTINGQVAATGANHYFGPFALSTGVGIRARLLFGADAVLVSEADATTADVSMIIRPKGAGTAQMQNSASSTVVAAGLTAGARSLGFFGTTPINKPAVTGSRSANAALASLLTQLSNFGLLTDSTSA